MQRWLTGRIGQVTRYVNENALGRHGEQRRRHAAVLAHPVVCVALGVGRQNVELR